MLSEEQKQQKLCPLSSNKSLLLRPSGSISEKKIDWHQTLLFKLIGRDVEWRTKTAKTVPTVFEQNPAFENLDLHFWEKNWLLSNIIAQIDWKRCWVKNKNSKYCAHCLLAKVSFWEPRPTFLINNWLTSNNDDQIDWEKQGFVCQRAICPQRFRR